jgi:targeting protein for Xklp2
LEEPAKLAEFTEQFVVVQVKEKEITYKRLREENEFAQKIEEEKALKQLRRTLVPQARPLPKFDRPFRPQR